MEITRKTFKKKIVTEELLKQINPKNIQLKNSFLKEKKTRSSDKTIEAYDSDLNIFFTWNLLNNNNKFFIDIKKLEFANFFSYVTDDLQWGSSRFSRLRACLSSLSQFVEKFYDDDYPDFKNVILRSIERMPKTPAREKTILSEEQVYSLLNYLKENDAQKACWFAVAVFSGARFEEILRFDVDNIDENNTAFDGLFIETLKEIKTKGRTRNGKMLKKYILKEPFLPYYKEWIIEREKIMHLNNQSHNSLFIKKDGSPAVGGTVRSWITEMSRFLKVPFYPHSARHFLTTYLSKIGLPHKLIKDLFGWDSTLLVEIYDDLTSKDRSWNELENLKKDLSEKNI